MNQNYSTKQHKISDFSFSIRTKIFIIILLPAFILTLVALMDYRSLTLLGRSSERILSENYNSIKAAQEIRQLLENSRNQVLLYIFGYEQAQTSRPETIKRITGLLDFCGDNITESEEKPVVKALNDAFNDYRVLFKRIALKSKSGPRDDEDVIRFLSKTAELITSLNHLVLINEKAMEKAQQETNQFAQNISRSSVTVLVTAVILSLIISIFLSRHLSKPLTELALALSTVKEGSGTYPVLEVNTHDEIGFLTAEFNRLFKRLEAFDRLSASRLMAEKEKVHQAEAAKARFIADLSHQLKTPMTSLAMSVGLLVEKGDHLEEGKKSRLLQTARDDCIRLTTLINELVDIAKLESMIVPRPKEVLEVERVVEETLRPLMTQADEKGIRLEIHTADNMPPVSIDSLRFPWVLTNLVGNAIRYTESGGTVRLTIKKNGPRCEFRCEDTGSGIDKKFLAKIFDRYTQYSEREKSGTIGLGLAIVKEIIEQHGGDISVESRIGRGTTFYFWIPIGEIKDREYENGIDYR